MDKLNKFLSFFKSASPLLLLGISIGLGILAKLIETKFTNTALSIQLITFVLFIYAIKKFFDKK